MALVCCSLVASFYAELQGLQCSLVDRDPGPEARPGMTHDPELSRDGLQLWPGGMFNFYCELFHISFIVSAGPGVSHELSSALPGPVYGLTNLSIGKPSNEIRLHPIISGTGCQACCLLVVACLLFLLGIFCTSGRSSAADLHPPR